MQYLTSVDEQIGYDRAPERDYDGTPPSYVPTRLGTTDFAYGKFDVYGDEDVYDLRTFSTSTELSITIDGWVWKNEYGAHAIDNAKLYIIDSAGNVEGSVTFFDSSSPASYSFIVPEYDQYYLVVDTFTSDGQYRMALGVYSGPPVTNTPPYDIAVAGPGTLVVNEFAGAGTEIGTLVGSDDGSLTYSLLDDAGGRFHINAQTGQLLVKDGLLLDFEQHTSHIVRVRVVDEFGESFDKNFSVTVVDRNPEQVTGNAGANHLVGGALADVFYGAAGNDTLNGQDGNDTLLGGLGADTLIGGGGFDYASYAGSAAALTARLDAPGLNTGEATGDTYNTIEGLIGSRFNDVLVGNGSANVLLGGAGNDTLYGLASNDTLNGQDGNDTLLGGVGADTLVGGLGNDVYVLENGADTVSDAGGIDTATSTISRSLAVGGLTAVENLTLVNVSTALNGTGNTLNNIITGNNFNNVLSGLGGNDTLNSGLGNDTLDGGIGNDRLLGGTGNDRHIGGAGIDTHTGGAGNDTFVFNAAMSTTTNRDVITDFANASGNNDICHLENAIFTKLGAGAAHALNPAFFKVGAAATDANDFLVYNKTTGVLSYDVNGSGSGGVTQICVLTNHPTLTAADFFVT